MFDYFELLWCCADFILRADLMQAKELVILYFTDGCCVSDLAHVLLT